MLMHSTPEGRYAIVTDVGNHTIRQAVPDLNCSVDEGPANRDYSGGGHSQGMAWDIAGWSELSLL